MGDPDPRREPRHAASKWASSLSHRVRSFAWRHGPAL